MALIDRIKDRSARMAIVGLGYVGLPLAVGFAKAGYPVLGIEVDADRADTINRGVSYIPDVDTVDLAGLVSDGKLRASTNYDELAERDIMFICVPTPFTLSKAPDISYIVQAAKGISKRLRAGQLVILQSTTHPGTTEEDVRPILELSGLTAGRDFYLAFCPERINPGDRKYGV